MPGILHDPFAAFQPQAKQELRKPWITAQKGTVLRGFGVPTDQKGERTACVVYSGFLSRAQNARHKGSMRWLRC